MSATPTASMATSEPLAAPLLVARLSDADLRAGRLAEQAHQLDPNDAAYRHLAEPMGVAA